MMMTMLHQVTEILPQTISPTISSISSSNFDTESTGSFFPDRSTTLGALMGVSTFYPTVTCGTHPHRRDVTPKPTLNNRNFVGRIRKRVRSRKWWWFCGFETSKRSSLEEFLEVEWRFGVDSLFSDAMMDMNFGDHHQNGSRMLFANGRVLPPAQITDVNERSHSLCSFCSFPVLLAGVCGGVL
ncbi:uncharacterized protein At3g17950-like [Rutidosis leptorrhynchoides]|uniref:uncharacterized protein At3g17950-like n=1 Tax=Rutidosis leptorrhynchoides TaxID=125765 RepID=UPI003A99A4D3